MAHGDEAPAAWFVRHAALVAAGARLLDVAAGRGRHARFFAARGVEVVAVDRDAEALSSLSGVPRVRIEVHDLEAGAWPYPAASFDAVLVSNYLWRPSFEALLATVRPGGVLLYETFMVGHERYGRPSRPEFLLRVNELLERLLPRFEVMAFEQGDDGQAVKQRVAARRLG
ncbi:MAG: class I SAM-dependent methyltransferase [Casimicrobiaceae bacterium]|nr:class I SAM-dependent methyltransferase [Casimicrobiaceae bacterium]MCX8098127.1 class I SAM-dependent methyltransferase [Casimicrobiaceae bacterium]MDW8311665.1 class I SAM-dependent methyltransferase [Burkholderiales bacterium]